ncbi:MAG: DNA-binding protein [Clostridia bacterium]|nr:DNA-binding protein [Clostridia bacterium]
MEKNIHISMLLEIYGKLLTKKQYDVVDLYYNQNLSLSEIAEEENITRQGVRKNLVDAENKLFDYEQKLLILKQRLNRAEIIEELIKETEDVSFKERLQKLL